MRTLHEPAACYVCQVITENPTLSNTQLGFAAGKSERSIRRHKAGRDGSTPMASVPEAFFSDVPTEAITSRGRSILTPDGWEKVTFDPKKIAAVKARETLLNDTLAALDGYSPTPADPKQAYDRAEVFAAADFQALADETPVWTTEGWKNHGDIRKGDFVFGADGLPKKVLAVTGSSVQNLFDVEFDHKITIRASGEHLWQGKRKYHPREYVQHGTGPSWEYRELTWTTSEIAEKVTFVNNLNGTPAPVRAFTVDLPKPLELGSSSELPIDPHLLGLWLGNGSHGGSTVTGDIRDWESYAKYGDVRKVKGRPGTLKLLVPKLISTLRTLGLENNKHVPEEYLLASTKDRLALLQGLMDSDGSCTRGGVAEFSNTNRNIAEGVMFLLSSLGWKFSVLETVGTLYGVEKRPVWRIQIPTFSNRMSLFRFPRKAQRQIAEAKEHVFLRQIQRITPVGRGSAQCLTVEGGLYLAGREMVLTHNCGKACETGGGTADTVERVMASAERFKERVLETKPKAIVITDLGDVIENMWNVPGHQLSTNDLDLTAQIRVARRLYLEILKLLAPLAPQVYFVSVPSNHGQVRTGPKETVGSLDNDFGVEISHQLEDICVNADSAVLRRITFIRPEKHQETAVLTVCGTKLAFHHGHRTKGGINGHDAWWANQDHGRMPGWDADILFVAHYHTPRAEQSGDGRWIICVSASEPSSDYFALSSGKRSKRGVTCVQVSNRIWSGLEIV